MEQDEKFTTPSETRPRGQSKIPRKPVGGQKASVAVPSSYASPRISSVEAVSPVEVVNTSDPPASPPGPSSEVPTPVEYERYRSPASQTSFPSQYVPYRKPSADRGSMRRGSTTRRPMNRSSIARGSLNRMSTINRGSINHGHSDSSEVSPISRISSNAHFRRPSVDDVISSISREVSQYQASDTDELHFRLSPLMELSAQEAALRNSIQIGTPAGSVVRSRAPTSRAGSTYQIPNLRMAPRSHISLEPICDWLPKALRWPFMLATFLISLGLGAITIGLTIVSAKHHGLGGVHDSPAFVFRWRFVPTILVVLWVMLTTAILNDVKRTEPYARLSRPDGASASSALFLKFRALWYEPFDALSRRKNDGNRNWALFWASMVNILGLLIIIPFSSALFSPREVSVSRSANYSTFSTTASVPLQLSTDDSILFRTISSALLNTTTSAWISNDYAVLPFWPSDDNTLPYSAAPSDSNQEWAAYTTVYQADLDCTPMYLQSVANDTLVRRLPSSSTITAYEILNLTSFVIESTDGCSLGLAGFPQDYNASSIFKSGGGWWAGPPGYSYPLLWPPDNGTLNGLDANHPILLNSSFECGDRSILFLTTPYAENQPFQAQGQVCASNYYSANVSVTVSGSGPSPNVSFNEVAFNLTKTAIDPSLLDVPSFENSFLSQNWSSKFQLPQSSMTLISPRIGGPLALLGAQNNFDLAKMLADPSLADQARQIKQRFFGESLQAALQTNTAQTIGSTNGNMVAIEQRIVLSLPIGIILTMMFFASSLMIGLTVGYTRLHERPLNLAQDPGSTSAMASLISSGQNTRALFEGLDTSSQHAMRRQLGKQVFYLRHGIIYSYDVRDAYQQSASDSSLASQDAYNESNTKDWRPRVLRKRILVMILVSLTALIATLAALFRTFQDSGISQSHLTSRPGLSTDNSSLTSIAPYSIIPTLIAVGVKLWWDSMDQTFRRLQPFMSMARRPTPTTQSTSLSYINTPLIWTAGKAAQNQHFLLALVATAAVLTEIFIISMSGNWNRHPGYSSHNATVSWGMDLRSVPAIFTVPTNNSSASSDIQSSKSVLTNVYTNMLANWIYGATLEGANNVTSPPWTSNDWAFTPLNLTAVQKATNAPVFTKPARNITVETSSLRARLECSQIDLSNTSTWLTVLDFTDDSTWNTNSLPSNLLIGYELKPGLTGNESTGNGTYISWDDSHPYFSFFAADENLQCCGNNSNGSVGEAAIGYWSPAADALHTSVVVKWITGHPFSTPFIDINNQSHFVWEDVPQVTALNCTPVFESASARVAVDSSTGVVQDYSIEDTPTLEPNAWSSQYQQLNTSAGLTNSSNVQNLSVSYGYLFHDVLLGAANSANIASNSTATNESENLSDRTYNFRLPGLNVDCMSYASLALVQNNNSALLDPLILANVSSTVFSTFFKHFAHSSAPSTNGVYINGSWGFQTYGAAAPPDLGAPLQSRFVFNMSNISTPPTAMVSTLVMKLDFNPAAIVLNLCILAFLFLTTAVILIVHRSYLRLLPRDVDTLGSVLGFVYSSERLLRSAEDDGSNTFNEKRQPEAKSTVMAHMGWFNSGGRRRWGIELVDDRDGAERENDNEEVTAELPAMEEVDPAYMDQAFRDRSFSIADPRSRNGSTVAGFGGSSLSIRRDPRSRTGSTSVAWRDNGLNNGHRPNSTSVGEGRAENGWPRNDSETLGYYERNGPGPITRPESTTLGATAFRDRQMSVDDYNGAYDETAERTPPLPPPAQTPQIGARGWGRYA